MAGYSSDGRYLYMGVSSSGMNVVQLGQWLKDRGAHNVIKMDGGGSAGIYYNGALQKGSNTRLIANHLAVIVDPAPPESTWQAKYAEGDSCWWDTNCGQFNGSAVPKCEENFTGPELHKSWGSSAPCGGMSGDNWVGNFTSTINFPSGNYVFHLDHDDGTKLWINGSNKGEFGGSGNHTICNGTGGFPLSGNQSLRAMIREEGGDAKLHLTWDSNTSVCIPPSAPTNLSATAVSQTQISLAWQDNSWDESNFRVERSPDGVSNWAEIANLPSNTTNYNDSNGLAPNTRYYYRVRAYRSSGDKLSDYSNVANATTIAPCPTITEWKGEYWNNDSLTGSPSLCRNDATIDFEWYGGSPDPLIPDDHFSARWTRTVHFTGGLYTFSVFHDDGFKFYLDGSLLFQDWCNECRETDAYTGLVPAGSHEIKLEVFENGGWAAARLNWEASLLDLTVNKDGTGSGTVTSNPAGINCGSDCSESYNSGTLVTLTATYAADSIFAGWSGDPDCSDGQVSMNASKTCTATFNDITPPTVSWIAPVGDRQVYDVGNETIQLEVAASDNVGISHVVFYRWDYINETYLEIGRVSTWPYLIDFDASSLLPGWNYVTAEVHDTSEYSTSEYIWLNHAFTLTVHKTGTGSGRVTSDPAGINCGSDCSGSYNSGTPVTLTASPAAESAFMGWSGGGCSGTGACTVSMIADTAVTARFSASPGLFNKLSPPHGTTGLPTNPTLSWSASSGAGSYSYCYDTTNDGVCSPWINNGNSTSTTLTGLSYATTYYWHVRAANGAGVRYAQNSSTAFWSFRTRSAPATVTFTATVEDGWVLESSETSSAGGTMNATQTTFNVGDGAGDKQYRSLLSFNAASLPDNAVITAVTFKVMQQSVAGTSPFTTHGNLLMDIKTGAFGGSNALQLADFQAAANKSGVVIPNTPAAGWYVRNLPANALPLVNKIGVTQFRLRFALDDNDDLAADLIRFFSGNAPAANRPKLIVQYYIP
jgi:hypothetical protein